MFGRLIRRDLADLNAVHSGQFVSNFLYDATLMRDALTQGVAAIFLEWCSWSVYLAYVLISDWQLGLLILVMLPAVAWAMERLGGSMRRAATRGMRETGDLSVALSEAMDGRRIIKAYGLEDHSVERVDARLKARLKTLLKAVRLRAAAAPVTDIFLGAGDGAGAVRGRLAESARPDHPQRLCSPSSPRCCWRSSRCAICPSSGPPPRPASPRPTACSPPSMRGPPSSTGPAPSR